MKKNLMFISAVATALLLGACTPSGGSSTPGSGGSSGGGSSDPITLNVWAGENEAGQAYMTEMGTKFSTWWSTNYPSSRPVNVVVSALSEANVKSEFQKDPNAAADFALAADDQLADLISAGYLQDLDSLPSTIVDVADVKSRNSAKSVGVSTYNEKLYAFPVSASNGYFLYYSSEFLGENDVKTFDGLLEALDKKSTETGTRLAFGFPTGSGWYIDGWWRAAGFNVQTDSTDSTGTGSTCTWDRTTPAPSGVDVAGAMLKLTHGQYGDHWIGAGDSTFGAMCAAGQNPRIVAWVSGTWNATANQDAWGTEYAKATVLPSYTINGTSYPMQSVAGHKVGIVNAVTGKATYAAAFGNFITNEENQIRRYEVCAEAPTNTSAAGKVDYSSNYGVKAMSDQINSASFVQQVGSGYWTPAGTLAKSIYDGTDGSNSLITSGDKTANLVINEANLQTVLTTTASAIRAHGSSTN